MLMVLMTLMEFGRSRVNRLTRWLWITLSGSLGAGATGCFEDDDTKVLYGPPPTDLVDAAEPDVPVSETYDPGQVPLYGPPDAVPLLDVAPEDVKVPDDCGMAVYYGPPPCDTDADCKQYGPEWYCDQNHSFDNGCGGVVVWPACAQGTPPTDVIDADVPADVRDCSPVAWYGPPPCQSDDDCKGSGSDWYCDLSGGVQDPCGGWIAYPQCKQSVDATQGDVPLDATVDCGGSVLLYGPPPCDTDEDCAWAGEGAKCVKDPCPPRCEPPK